MRRTERERLARKRELERYAGLKKLTAEEVRNFPGRFRRVAGWCTEVERLHFDRSSYEIIELDDGPYAFCAECARMIRAQLAELHAKGKLPSA
jgi:hypothetical protein